MAQSLPPRGEGGPAGPDEGKLCHGNSFAGSNGTPAPHQSAGGAADSFSLRSKSRCKQRLRSDTRLRAQPQGGKPYKPKADSPLSGLSVYIYSTSIPQAPSARVKDFGFLYKIPVIPRLYAAWALALLSSTKIDSS